MSPSYARWAHPQSQQGGAISLRSSDPAEVAPPPTPKEPQPHAMERTWTLDDLDREFQAYCDHVRYADGWSLQTVRSLPVAYRNFRTFLAGVTVPGLPIGRHLYAIEAWLQWNRLASRGGHTLNTYWRRLRSFVRWLARKHGLPDPFDGLRPPPLPSHLPKARSPEECLRILEAAENYPWEATFDRTRAVALLAVALYAGLRRRELVSLKHSDVNLDDGAIRVVAGKGRGGGKDRIIPLAPDLRTYLDAYLRQRRLLGIVAPEFFCTRQTKRGMSETTLRRIVDAVRRASGIPFGLHSLRHSFVTQLLRSGVPLHTASALAGHNQITTTAGYLKVFDEDKVRAVRMLRY